MDIEQVARPVYHQQHLSKAARPLGGLGDALVRLGQLQLLRKGSEFYLAFLATYDSKLLHSAIKNLNSGVVAEQKASGKSEVDCADRDEVLTHLAHRLTTYLNLNGLTDPYKQVYLEEFDTTAGSSGSPPRLPELIFLVVISTLSKLQFSSGAGELVAKKQVWPLASFFLYFL